MKESMGMTVTLGIIIIFVVLVFAFLAATLSYYKSYKVNNKIIENIERYEGVNGLSINAIENSLSTIGYNVGSINCDTTRVYRDDEYWFLIMDGNQYMSYINSLDDEVDGEAVSGKNGYCVYALYYDIDGDVTTNYDELVYIQYGVLTKMTIDLPVLSRFFSFDVFSASRNLYRFGKDW